jgi:endonuclease YncB( thermonuclease family)
MGTLRIHGTIDIKQFWPNGSSDADTTKIKLVVGEDSFEYKEDDEKDFSKTNAFKDAISKGQGSKPVINTSKRDGTQTITVRLQGVDAPELHYRAAPLKKTNDVSDEERAKFNSINEERRQYFAESSTFALAKHLEQYMNDDGLITAIFQTNVEKPFEVVDTYGRFIGNINVGEQHDINVWLVENGWGLPAFYTSMSIEEMEIFIAAWVKGKTIAGRTGKATSKDANDFDWELIYRKPSPEIDFKLGDDKGKVLMPKIFRRQSSWMVSKKAGVITRSTSFQSYLKKSPDQLILFNELLSQGLHSATTYSLHDFVSADNLISKNPEELIFKEKPGTLVNSKGVKITKW